MSEQDVKKPINKKTVKAPHRTKVDYYEYEKPQYEADISEQRKNEIIEELKRNIEKKESTIAHFKILDIAKDNDDELDFIYDWLLANNIEIRGFNRNYSR